MKRKPAAREQRVLYIIVRSNDELLEAVREGVPIIIVEGAVRIDGEGTPGAPAVPARVEKDQRARDDDDEPARPRTGLRAEEFARR